jgi:NAD(P)-dependent dehydrogenase (short-subunit alcohol dehydrogenase family)
LHTFRVPTTRLQIVKLAEVDNRVAIVTGASQGIGAGLVRGFRDRTYTVVATSRSIEPSSDPGVVTIAGDISSPEVGERVVGEAVRRFGKVDCLVNNAGIFIGKPFGDYTEADFANAIGTNLRGFFRITQAAMTQMTRQGSGHVVNITASLVDRPSSQIPAFLAAVTKGGLNYATRALAIEYASRGIRVNAVAPGHVKTPMHPAETHAMLAKLHPLGRMAEVSDIVEAVLFLETAEFVTGEILHVDGGQSVGH